MPKIIEDASVYQAVIQVVIERGYTGATTKQMAEAANISEVTLFRKYGSKQQLVKQAISSIISQTDLAAADEYTGDLRADLLRILQAYQDSAVKHGNFVFALFSELSRYPELADTIDEPMNIYLGMGEMIARYQEEGQLKIEHPLYSIAVLLGPIMYMAILRKTMINIEISPIDLTAHVERFLEGRQIKAG